MSEPREILEDAMIAAIAEQLHVLPDDQINDLLELIPEWKKSAPGSKVYEETLKTVGEILFPARIGGIRYRRKKGS